MNLISYYSYNNNRQNTLPMFYTLLVMVFYLLFIFQYQNRMISDALYRRFLKFKSIELCLNNNV